MQRITLLPALSKLLLAVALVATLAPFASAMGLPGVFVQVMTPNGGERWRINSTHAIEWMGVELPGPYTVQIKRHPRQRWQTIARDVEGSTYNWKVSGPATREAVIRVYTYDTAGKYYEDVSDAPFTIFRR